jgi:hypothetical protein
MLQSALGNYDRSAVPAPIDRDVADACAALASTYETASRGIIYEQRATSLPAQRLASELRAVIERALRPAERPVDRDLAAALRATELMARNAAAELEGGDRAYLELIERRMGQMEPRSTEVSEPADDRPAGLIIPG